MSTHPNPIRVLCFGDSNTWGYSPTDQSRFPKSVRWTGRLQTRLGTNYEIIEEGLNGRTTKFDYAARPGKNGLTYLCPCMDSHFPVDIVVVCLGTNDTKVEFGLTPEQIAGGFEEVVQAILGKGLERPSPNVKVVAVSPALVDERYIGDYADIVGAEAKTRAFASLYENVARKYGAAFVDLAKIVTPSTGDGCHLDPESHERIAEVLAREITGIFQSC